ncbi:uncharacterized protein TNIN_475181 [Trichonephila inaurata madagascariensis]|uniref:Uncharacterized protein n=1 Tax=Trichonephila inaurata madagascariensis TaxID=2747483 RepID=A0A8X6Y7U7_9ARAC|nr:uncharacterized protein TNIN_475181 [Trichonephila inaurata madagascariensis]
MRIDLGPHMAVVMFEYPITSETCFINPQDMCNETLLCVLLLQQLFTEGQAVSDSHLVLDLARLCTKMGIASQTVKTCAQYFYSKPSHGLMRVCLPRASLLHGGVLHPPVLPSGRSAIFQYREDWMLARRFPYFAICCPAYGWRRYWEDGGMDIDGHTP